MPLADALEPVATVLVNAGYPDNRPTANPDRYVPGGILPPPRVVTTALHELPAAIQQGAGSLRRNDERDSARTAVTQRARTRLSNETQRQRRVSANFSTRLSSDGADTTTTRLPGGQIARATADAVERPTTGVRQSRVESAAPDAAAAEN